MQQTEKVALIRTIDSKGNTLLGQTREPNMYTVLHT